jgi:hypothetical protein
LKAGEYTVNRPKTAVRLAEKRGSNPFFATTQNPVGASLLAKKPKAPLGIWLHALSFTTIASVLAPTRIRLISLYFAELSLLSAAEIRSQQLLPYSYIGRRRKTFRPGYQRG